MTNELREILTSVLEVDAISDEDSSETIPSWDSVRHLSLIMAIEEHYGITFEADEISKLVSVRAIATAVENARQAAGGNR
jgi:acyl carrier protein